MNAARRARQKAQPDRRRHDHHNREARTLTIVEDGKVINRVYACPKCRPPSEKNHG